VAAAVTLKGDPAADIEKQTRDAFERRADTIVNSASRANHAQYVQAVSTRWSSAGWRRRSAPTATGRRPSRWPVFSDVL
jgi:hypothetical protein